MLLLLRSYFLVGAPLLLLWGVLLYQLSGRWYVYEQYAYGWYVPVIALAIFWRKSQEPGGWRDGGWRAAGGGARTEWGRWKAMAAGLCPYLVALLALGYLPTRMIQGELTNFRMVDWALAIETVGLTLLVLFMMRGWKWVSRLVFPICFILVAIPWPTFIENRSIHGLARADSIVSAELLGWFNIPAIVHGRTIAISTGTVGVNDACSGIRSLQSCLMVSVLLGELYRLNLWRRITLVSVGFVLAFFFNVCRTSLLVWVASTRGIAAISDWHDSAGVSITLACLVGLCVAATFLRRHGRTSQGEEAGDQGREVGAAGAVGPAPPPLARYPAGRVNHLCLALLVWLLGVEVGTRGWSQAGETARGNAAPWTVRWPEDNSSFKRVPLAPLTQKILACHGAQQGQWVDADGGKWQVFLFEWFPGRFSRMFATRHSPEVCMQNSGFEVLSASDPATLSVQGLSLPFRRYAFRQDDAVVHVFYCQWDAEVAPASGLRTYDLLRGAWVPRRELGYQVLEMAVSGYADLEKAQAAVVRQLERLIEVKPITAAPVKTDETGTHR